MEPALILKARCLDVSLDIVPDSAHSRDRDLRNPARLKASVQIYCSCHHRLPNSGCSSDNVLSLPARDNANRLVPIVPDLDLLLYRRFGAVLLEVFFHYNPFDRTIEDLLSTPFFVFFRVLKAAP